MLRASALHAPRRSPRARPTSSTSRRNPTREPQHDTIMTDDNRQFTTDSSESGEQTFESAVDDAAAFVREMHNTDRNKQDEQSIKMNPFDRDLPPHTILIGNSRRGVTCLTPQDGSSTGGDK